MGAKVHHLPILPEMSMGWLTLLVLIALFFAAFLHWKRVKHWSLLLLTIAPLCLILAYISFRLGEFPLRGATIDEIASGARQALQSFIHIGVWLACLGLLAAGIGATGSIVRALKNGCQDSSTIEDRDLQQ